MHPYRHHRVRRALEDARDRLCDAWAEELADERQLSTIQLQPTETGLPNAGSRPQVSLVDDRGRAYLFKVAPTDQIAAELLAARARALGRQLHVPVARRSIEIGGRTSPVGMLQPRLDIVGTLPNHPQDWSDLQVESLLRDHPWEWLLANLDTHIDQYVLVGPARLPLNIDWDHSLVDLATTQLTRFNRRSAAVIPVRNFLYSEYVAGSIDLDFYGMQLEAHRIADIPFAAIEGLLERWAAEAEVDVATRSRVVASMSVRHAHLASDFDRFVHELRDERDATSPTHRGWPRRVTARVQDAWQRFALVVLHDRVVRPVLSLRRKLALRGLTRA